MKIHCGLTFLILTLATLTSFSQDTLLFQKKNDESKIFKLPLNDFEVKIKPNDGKRKKVIITDYNDSILTMKVWSLKGKERKSKRKEIQDLYKDYPLKRGMPDDTIHKRIAIIDSLLEEIQYSGRANMHINEIDKLIIKNKHNPKMKTVLKVTEWAAVAVIVVGLPLIAVFQSFAYYITWNALGVGVITVSIITENKKLKLRNWKIKKKTAANI